MKLPSLFGVLTCFLAAALDLRGTAAAERPVGGAPAPIAVASSDASVIAQPEESNAGDPRPMPVGSRLQQRVAPNFQKTPLRDVVRWFENELQVNFLLKQEDVPLETPITFVSPGVPAKEALRRILEPLKLEVIAANEFAIIRSDRGYPMYLYMVPAVYDVTDLVSARCPDGRPVADFQPLLELLPKAITRFDLLTWRNTVTPFESPGIRALVVLAMPDQHEEIAELFAKVRAARHAPDAEREPDEPDAAETNSLPQLTNGAPAEGRRPVPPEEPATIEAVLQKKVAPRFENTPLPEVASWFAERLQLEIRLERKMIAEEGISLDEPITFAHPGIRAKSALTLILDPLGLAFVELDGGLLITTQLAAEDILETRVYDVSDLVAARDVDGKPMNDFKRLQEALYQGAEIWDPSRLVPVEAPGVCALAIRVDAQRHASIVQLLNGLRAVRDGGIRELPLYDDVNPQIVAALQTKVSAEFRDATAREMLAWFEQRLGIPLVIDSPSLQDEAISLDQRQSLTLRAVPAKSALELILSPLGAATLLQHDVLRITTELHADDVMRPRLYDVADLVVREVDGELVTDFAPLEQAIYEGTNSGWAEIDGVSDSLTVFEAVGLRVLVVTALERIHRETGSVLEELRRARHGEPPRPDLSRPPVRKKDSQYGFPDPGRPAASGSGE